ncbi:MAG: efflux RND transporter permease subunit, partial [Candidatus Taylorbacteria bacterium]
MKQKILPTLYSRTSTGAIQEWKIEVLGNQFRVICGQTDGKKVVNEWTTCVGMNIGKKNETSPDEQAVAEATSKWEKKKKTGYTDDITEVDTCTTYVEPMLAKNFKDRLNKIDWKLGVLVENKFNGNRAIATLKNEIIKLAIAVSIVCLIFLFHLPSALVVIVTLPIAIIISFICMYYLGVTSNIMSLSGIAIAIGAMVDASIIMVENAHKKLEEWEQRGSPGNRTDVIIAAARE